MVDHPLRVALLGARLREVARPELGQCEPSAVKALHVGKTAREQGELPIRHALVDPPVDGMHVDPGLTGERAEAIARHVAEKLDLVGVLAVEMFLTESGAILVNEIALRPHNSGHWTIDACFTSQFEQLVRAICGLPLGSVEHHSDAVMKNLLGGDVAKWRNALDDPLAKLHLYGKTEIQPGRKMGHVTHLIPHR